LLLLLLQVIGKLPFDDANHKKLLKLIFSGPIFPVHRESSLDFQDLVVAILSMESTRIGIPEIRRSVWYIKNESPFERSTTQGKSFDRNGSMAAQQ